LRTKGYDCKKERANLIEIGSLGGRWGNEKHQGKNEGEKDGTGYRTKKGGSLGPALKKRQKNHVKWGKENRWKRSHQTKKKKGE